LDNPQIFNKAPFPFLDHNLEADCQQCSGVAVMGDIWASMITISGRMGLFWWMHSAITL
jgi:hypothetical protein